MKVHRYGEVKLLDSMGNDDTIVKAARISTGQGLKSPEEDEKLLRYLLKNKHTSPFEQVVFQFYIKLPIFVARQLVRHRTARLNEESARYHPLADEIFVFENLDTAFLEGRPFAGEQILLRAQDTKNKQGSSETVVPIPIELYNRWYQLAEEAHEVYQKLLAAGVAREIARIHLPLSTYTRWVWQIDLHNFMHFLRLRLHPHAQEEIRDYAFAMLQLVKPIVPVTMQIFEESLNE